jgi:hypothetical protein
MMSIGGFCTIYDKEARAMDGHCARCELTGNLMLTRVRRSDVELDEEIGIGTGWLAAEDIRRSFILLDSLMEAERWIS